MSGPRMGMPHMNGTNRRPPPNMNRAPSTNNDRPAHSQHDDLIKYICDSWNKVYQEVDKNTGSTAIFYQEQDNPNLKDFEPFDLEGFWGRRLKPQQPHS